MKGQLCLYTIRFPYGKGETFLESEIEIIATRFKEIHVFPLEVSKEKRTLPPNVMVHDVFTNFNPNANHMKIMRLNCWRVLGLFVQEIFKGRFEGRKYKEKLQYTISFFGRAKVLKRYLVEKKLLDTIHYTYWFDIWATCLSILNIKYVSRVHGFDLFEERSKNKFIHFRDLQLKKVQFVYSVSKAGRQYLQNKYPKFRDKCQVSYLGTADNGMSPRPQDEVFRVVSCSNVIPLKRVWAIIDVLKGFEVKVEWVHYGDGPLLKEMKGKAAELPDNVSSIFMGREPNQKVLEYYASTPIDLFINLSESEGLPVSIMEALSFGIPAIATNVGGTCEIVCENSGWLVEKNFDIDEIRSIVKKNMGQMRDKNFRNNVRAFWEVNFDAKINYIDFVKGIHK